MTNKKIEIYTDGSCLGNPGPGGWGVLIIIDNKKIKLTGGKIQTTNNRMEMMAIIQALKWIRQESEIDDKEIQTRGISIYSDSNLIIQTLNQGWKRKANQDLWAEIDLLKAWLPIKWFWVKAHHENKYNNEVDKIAFKEANKFKKLASP